MRIFFIAFFLLSLYACDNDLTTIGDNLIPNDHYVEVTRFILDETSTIKLDSFPTSSMSTTSTFQLTLGKIEDYITGITKAIPYFQVSPTGFASSVTWETNCVFDSLTLKIPNPQILAGDTTQYQTFDLYQLDKHMIYNIDNPIFCNIDSLPWYKKLATLTNYPQQESYTRELYFKINDTIGQNLFNRMRSRDPMFEDNYLFMDYLKGFAIVPQDNNSVLTSLSATDIQLRCYYHIGSKEGLYFSMPTFSSGSYAYTNIKYEALESFPLKNATFLDSIPFQEGRMAVIEGMNGFMLKIKIPFIADVTKYKTIVKAEIELRPKTEVWENIPEPQLLSVYVVSRDNYVRQTLTDNSSNTIYGILSQNVMDVDSKKYTIDLTDFYIRQVEGVQPLDKDIYLLIGLPGYIYSPWSGYQIFAGDVYNKFQRVIFEELPVFSIYYSNYK